MRFVLVGTMFMIFTGAAKAENHAFAKLHTFTIGHDNSVNLPILKTGATTEYAGITEYKVPPIEEVENGKRDKLKVALNRLNFVSTEENTQNANLVYTKVGGYKLTLNRVTNSLQVAGADCKRAAAYAEVQAKDVCKNVIVDGLYDFAEMNNNSQIPDLTKRSALNDASYGNYIDFEHAARLAKMHYQVCASQNNRGYVAMTVSAVPCSGSGDVLSIAAADQMGLLH